MCISIHKNFILVLNFVNHVHSIEDHPLKPRFPSGLCDIPEEVRAAKPSWKDTVNYLRLDTGHTACSYLSSEKVNKPWDKRELICKLNPLPTKKDTMSDHQLHQHASSAISSCSNNDSIDFYTDGSITKNDSGENRVGCGVFRQSMHIHNEFKSCYRLPDSSSILTAELTAIFLAIVNFCKLNDYHSYRCVNIHIDSIGAIESLRDDIPKDNFFICNTINKAIIGLTARNVAVTLNWIPSHCNIPGNDIVDSLAKQGTGLSNVTFKAPPSKATAKASNKRLIRDKWYKRFDSVNSVSSNWLKLCTRLKAPVFDSKISRKDEVTITQLRLNLRMNYCAANSLIQLCSYCGEEYSAAHYISGCYIGNSHRLKSGLPIVPGLNRNSATTEAAEVLHNESQKGCHNLLKYIHKFPPQMDLYNKSFILALKLA